MAQSKLVSFFQPKHPKLVSNHSTAETKTVSFSQNADDFEEGETEYFSVKSFLLQRALLELDSPDSIISAPGKVCCFDEQSRVKLSTLNEQVSPIRVESLQIISDFNQDHHSYDMKNETPLPVATGQIKVMEAKGCNPTATIKSRITKKPVRQSNLQSFFSPYQANDPSDCTRTGQHAEDKSVLCKRPPVIQQGRPQGEESSRIENAKTGKKSTLDMFVRKIQRNCKHSGLASLGTSLMQQVFGFLSYTEMTRLSGTSYFLNQCFRGMWFHARFLSEMDLSKYSSLEIRKILQKSRLPHNKLCLEVYYQERIWTCVLKETRLHFLRLSKVKQKKESFQSLKLVHQRTIQASLETLWLWIKISQESWIRVRRL
jgi:hypothetical protein